MNTPHITQVRQSLLDTLADLRNRENPMDLDRAKAVATVASVLVDTARVENEYLRITGTERAQFLEQPPELPAPSGYTQGVVSRLPGVTSHRMKG